MTDRGSGGGQIISKNLAIFTDCGDTRFTIAVPVGIRRRRLVQAEELAAEAADGANGETDLAALLEKCPWVKLLQG